MIQRKLFLTRFCYKVVNASLKSDHPQSLKFIIMFKVVYVKYRQITKRTDCFLDKLAQAELMGISVFFNTPLSLRTSR